MNSPANLSGPKPSPTPTTPAEQLLRLGRLRRGLPVDRISATPAHAAEVVRESPTADPDGSLRAFTLGAAP